MAAAVAGRPPLAVADGARAAEEEPSAEEVLRDAEQAFGEIFSVQAPRDIVSGMWSGISCVLSGVVLGVAGVVTQPIEGMRDSGVTGCFRGLALGLFTGVFFSMTGLCTGMFQAVRGAIATPRAVCMLSKGWRWDGSQGTWSAPQAYSLPDEARKVLGSGAGGDDEDDEGGGGAASPSRRRAVDTFFYDQLGVAPAASQREIRQAYFLQSKKWHPDKSAEPRAKERFQAISEAYQVLSDSERRRKYDLHGRQSAGEGFVDARVFFSVLLGADVLEPHIGQLRLAEMFNDALSGDADSDEAAAALQRQANSDRSARQQARRRVKLAVSLAERLDARRREEDTEAESVAENFWVSALEEARGFLKKDPSTKRFLLDIGWVYQSSAESFLARQRSRFGAYGLEALRLTACQRGHQASRQAQTAKLAVRSYLKLRRIVNDVEESDLTATEEATELPEAISSALPTFMETFWSLTAHDITNTLDKVVEKVLSDDTVGLEGQHLRAVGLRDLGAAFLEAASNFKPPSTASGSTRTATGECRSDGLEDERNRKRFEEAFLASMASGSSR